MTDEWFSVASMSQPGGGVTPNLACTLIAVEFATWLLSNKSPILDTEPTAFVVSHQPAAD